MVAQVDMKISLPQLIQQMSEPDHWEDAGLAECLAYVRSSKYLIVSDEFKGVLL